MFTRILPSALAITGVVGLAACGGGSSGDGGKATTEIPAGAVVVDAIDGNKLDKAEYAATAGTVTIAYLNKSSINHTLKVLKSEDSTQVGTMLKVNSQGDTDVSEYNLAAGTYTLFCNITGHEKMKATLVVK